MKEMHQWVRWKKNWIDPTKINCAVLLKYSQKWGRN